MIPNNVFSSLTCQALNSKADIESILQRITPIEFVPNPTIEYLGTLNMAYLTGPNLGTLTVQSNLETLNIEALSGYIHELAVDTLTINGFTGLYTGPTGPTGYTGLPGFTVNTGATGPTGAMPPLSPPLEFFSSSQTTLSITDNAPTVIRSNVSFEAGTPADGFSKVVINGYTGPNILSPIATSIGSMLNGPINTMETVGNTVYIGGGFTGTVDGSTVYPYIAKWDANNGLQQVDGLTGPNNTIYSMAYDTTNSLLYVGGAFTTWAGTGASPSRIGSFYVANSMFQSLGVTGITGNTGAFTANCSVLTMDNDNNKLFGGWNSTTRANQLFMYENNEWHGITGATGQYPRKILPDNANNIIYVSYDSSSTSAMSKYRTIVSVNTTTAAVQNIYTSLNSDTYTTMTMNDGSKSIYIGVANSTFTSTNLSLPFGGKSYMGTYVHGGTLSSFQEITNPINYLNYDKTNSELYICANTFNSTLSANINQQPYQSIVKHDGASFQNVADVDIYPFGIMASPTSSGDILVSPYIPERSILQQQSKIANTNQVYIYNCGRIHQDASLSITAPINYYQGNTGSSYTLYTIGDEVDMKWSSTTNSWWV